MAMIAYAYKTNKYTDPTLTDDAGTGLWGTGTSSFTNVQSGYYWSSATYALNPDGAWHVSLFNGNMSNSSKTVNHYVWPVRGGQSGSFGTLRIE
jgi:hypothetical protein